MVSRTVSLVSKDGKRFDVSIGELYASTVLKNMIHDIGFDKIKDGPLPVDVEGVILQKVFTWIEYQGNRMIFIDPNDADEYFDSRSLDEERDSDIENRKKLIQEKKDELEKLGDLKDVEEDEKAKELEDTSTWRRWNEEWKFKTKEKESDIRELEKNLDEREKYHLDRKNAAMRKYSDMAWDRCDEEDEKVGKWESNFLDIEIPLLLKIIQAAHFLDITGLLATSCKNAAARIKDGLLDTLHGLPDKIQLQIADLLLPCAYLDAAHAGTIPVSTSCMIHAQIWAQIYKSDAWFEAALAAGANPILIGKDLDKFPGDGSHPQTEINLVLASLDCAGRLKYHLPRGTSVLDFLHPGRYGDGEYTRGNIKLNISQDQCDLDHSRVRNLQQRLIQTNKNGWETSTLHLFGLPKILRVAYETSEPPGELRSFRVLTSHVKGRDMLRWLCVEYDSSAEEWAPSEEEMY